MRTNTYFARKNPAIKVRKNAKGNDAKGDILKKVNSQKAVNIPNMAKSPWDKLIIPMMPTIKFAPIAKRAYNPPRRNP
jgi:hypothetical protein